MLLKWCGVGVVNTVKKRLTTKGAVFSARFGGAGGIGCSLMTSAPTANGRAVMVMPDCKWMQDEVCVNADCPMCADYCPVVDNPGVCRYEERGNSDAQKGKRQTGAQ